MRFQTNLIFLFLTGTTIIFVNLTLFQKELQRFGICALGRKKAVAVLQHVYEQTHPLVTDSEAESSFSKTPLKKPGKRRQYYFREKDNFYLNIPVRSKFYPIILQYLSPIL